MTTSSGGVERLLAAVRTADVEFATMRDPPADPPSLERRILVTAPPELVELSGRGEVDVLERLVDLLAEPDRAWAAQVLLSAMTRREEPTVQAFAASPEEWLAADVGRDAPARWRAWLGRRRGRLGWDPARRAFVERPAG